MAFRPHLTIGLVLQVWDLRSPDRTETAPSGAGLAHFDRFFHGRPPERRLKVGEKPALSE
jgi:hypothetical protein